MNHHSCVLMGLCPLEVFNEALSASQALMGLCLLILLDDQY